VYHALDIAADAAMALPDPLPEDIHPAAGKHLLAELDAIDTPKADEPLPPQDFFRVKASQLGARFDHDHARQQRPAGNVPFNPELILANILVPHDAMLSLFDMNDRIQVLHVAPLRIHLTNGVLVIKN